jgi:hypothetical protein
VLSRNKVAVPEGAAGTPPFWRSYLKSFLINECIFNKDYLLLVVHFFLFLVDSQKVDSQ